MRELQPDQGAGPNGANSAATAWNEGDFNEVEKRVAPTCAVYTNRFAYDSGSDGDGGPALMKESVEYWRAIIPDLEMQLTQEVREKDQIAVESSDRRHRSETRKQVLAMARSDQPRTAAFMRWALILRAVVVLALGAALFASGAKHAVVTNMLATFWLAGALLTLRWAREHRGSPRSRLALLAGVAGGAAAVVLLARFMIEAVISLDATLAILGIAAVVVGTLRVVGAFRDEPGDRPRPAIRLALGASEIAIGVVWIAVDEVSRTLSLFAGACALVLGTSMLVGALDMRRRSLGGVRP